MISLLLGENGQGNAMNQFSSPYGLCVDDDQTVYIDDCANHTTVEWKYGARTGRVVTDGNGKENRSDQLYCPTDMIIDKERNSLIICDYRHEKVVR
ncbi:unnamed protein product [Rotaria sp. Silwood2]|nr:unnamed protein product [Rotaria sp. Silwood2]CAF4621219.1 unnamed protein product [Rotaria sp. Silwood2]